MRVFVLILGFHEDHAIRVLTEFGAIKEDNILVFTAKPAVPAVRRAFEGLRSYALRAGLKEPKIVEVPQNFYEGISVILEALEEFNIETEHVFELSGGMRYLLIYLLLALILSRRKGWIVIYPEGGEEKEIVIPKQVLELTVNPPGKAELNVLKQAISAPGTSVEEISLQLGKSVKTIQNIVSMLVKEGLVIRKGRRGGIYPTKLGELVSEYMKS